jgi:hypothetical protein
MDGRGFWLNPITGRYYLVGNHAPWVFDPANARAAGLPDPYITTIRQFDPIRNDDEIRLLAVMGGLVRTREHVGRKQYTSVQFFCDRPDLSVVLCAVTRMLRQTSGDQYADVHLHNLLSDCCVRRSLDQLSDSVESPECIALCDQLCQSGERSQHLGDLIGVVRRVLDQMS